MTRGAMLAMVLAAGAAQADVDAWVKEQVKAQKEALGRRAPEYPAPVRPATASGPAQP